MSKKTQDHHLWDNVKKTISPINSKKLSSLRDEESFEILMKKECDNMASQEAASHQVVDVVEKKPIRSKEDISSRDAQLLSDLAKGRVSPAARLDLHGLTKDEAYKILCDFIITQRGVRRKCVLVITGKGRDGQGVLRQKLPIWLDSNILSPHILLSTVAHAKHGGGGAFYVILRKH